MKRCRVMIVAATCCPNKMSEEASAKRRFAEVTFFCAIIFFMIVAVTGVQAQAVQPIRQSNPSQTFALTEALQADFGPAVEAVTAFRPFYLTGDFNGDGVQDVLVVVRIKGRRSTLTKDVRVIDPFQSAGSPGYPADPSAEVKLGLAIIHSWKTPRPAVKFLVIGDSPLLILEYSRASLPDDRDNLMELMRKHGKRRKGEKFPPRSKGDVILLGTEVGGDSKLYWNGKNYHWEDSPDD